jgi:hypothetical protein
MANGKKGDDPLMDILVYRIPVYSPEIDAAVREIHALGGDRDILDRTDWSSSRPRSELARELRQALEELRELRRQQGWELP